MGDTRKQRKKYTPPSHPWQRARIDAEKAILKKYALRRKIDVWKMSSAAKTFAVQTKKLISSTDSQSLKERELLLAKLRRLGLLSAGARIEEALGISANHILDRRLQTIVHKKQLARSMAQARQFIVHGHITIGQKTITSPSYLVSVQEEGFVQFSPRSAFASVDHPERVLMMAVEETGGQKEEKQSKEERKEVVKEEKKEEKVEKKIKPRLPKRKEEAKQ